MNILTTKYFKENFDEKQNHFLNLIMYRRENGGYATLYSKLLKKFYGDFYLHKVINPLVGAGIITINHHYIVDEESKKYKIIHTEDRVTEQLTLSDNFATKLKNAQKTRKNNSGIVAKMAESVRNVKFDRVAAKKYIKDNYFDDIEQYNSLMISVDNMTKENRYCHQNDTNFRVDTNFTNLKSDLLQFVKFEEEMVQLDISNSQPLLMLHILHQQNPHDEEIKYLFDQAQKGNFYEIFSDILGITRQQFKEEYAFKMLYGFLNDAKLNQKFPKFFEAIRKYKSNKHCPFLTELSEEKKGNARFAINMQRKESEIWIDNIMPKVYNQTTNVIGKHDCVIVPVSQKEEIEKIILEEYQKNGITPKLKIEKINNITKTKEKNMNEDQTPSQESVTEYFNQNGISDQKYIERFYFWLLANKSEEIKNANIWRKYANYSIKNFETRKSVNQWIDEKSPLFFKLFQKIDYIIGIKLNGDATTRHMSYTLSHIQEVFREYAQKNKIQNVKEIELKLQQIAPEVESLETGGYYRFKRLMLL